MFILGVRNGAPLETPFFSAPPSSAFPTFVPPVPLAGPAFDRGLLTPYVQQYNVSLETALNNNLVLQATYVGANGRKLFRTVGIDQARLASPQSPVTNAVTGQVFESNSPADAQLRAPLQGVSITGFSLTESTADSSYNSFQVSFTARTSTHLQLLTAYTYAKSIDNASGLGGGAGITGVVNTGAVVDEDFFVSDTPEDGGANPLGFILDSVVGGMVATEHPLLLLLSTPWTKAGIVYEQHRDRDLNLDRLIWQASTLQMFPGANQLLMARHRKDRGEDFYQREYMAQFSEDAIAYIEAADIDAAISEAPFFLAKPGMFYHMGLDPGRKRDHFGAAVAHSEAGSVIVDWCREWKPGVDGLKYAAILPEIWARAREYGIRKIASDQVDFGGIEASIPRDAYGTAEFTLERIMTGGQSGAELADTTRALFAQRKLVLPNQPGLAEEFKRLADYLTLGGGRDVRAKRGADDRSRAIMLAVYQAFKQPNLRQPWSEVLMPGRSDDGDDARFWQKLN